MSQFLNSSKLSDLYSENKNKNLVDFYKKRLFKVDDMYLDISKNFINDNIINEFIKVANEDIKLKRQIDDMFLGKKINFTEDRSVLHTAIRQLNPLSVVSDNEDYTKEVQNTFNKVCDFANRVRSGEFKGYTNKKFKYIINIGIGGSYLGTQMLSNSLDFIESDFKLFFLSSLDSANLKEILNEVNLEETLVVIASKTFTTLETMHNANLLRDYFIKHLHKNSIKNHFIALSTNSKAVEEFGISLDNMFGFWDFIGGRYSISSAIAMPVIIKVGVENYKSFLNGASIMDEHFKTAPLKENLPFLLAIIGIWYNNFYDYKQYAIIPYSYLLRDFPRYVQQLDMESNGKSVDVKGNLVSYKTGLSVFGEPGPEAQHSFFQLLHQGTSVIPCDFIGVLEPKNQASDLLMSNMLAQSLALMLGKNISEVEEELKNNPNKETLKYHKYFAGNRPTNLILLKNISAKTVGMLSSLYEHKVFVQGKFWQINSFDQWGVELGKSIASQIGDHLGKKKTLSEDKLKYIKDIIDIYDI